MECVNISIFPSSFIINVLRGNWISLTGEKKDQILVNFYTFFKVFAFSNNSDSIEEVHKQPFFASVKCIENGPEKNGLASFFELLPTSVVQMVYNERENFFVKVTEIKLPDICVNPSYIQFTDNSLVVSCAHGGICAFSANDSTNEYSLVYEDKPTNVVLLCYRNGDNTISRVEGDNIIANYGGNPLKRTTKKNMFKHLFQAFSYHTNDEVFCTSKKIFLMNNGKVFYIPYPEDVEETTKDPIISQCTIPSSGSHILLTLSGNLMLLQDYKLKYLRKIPNAYSVFYVASDLIIVQRKGESTLIFHYQNFKTRKKLDADWGKLEFREGIKGQFISNTEKTLHYCNTGIQTEMISNYELSMKIEKIIPFVVRNEVFYILTYSGNSIILNKEMDVIKYSLPFRFSQEIETKGLMILSSDEKEAFIQLNKNGIFINGMQMDSKLEDYGRIKCFGSTKKKAIIFFSKRMRILLNMERSSLSKSSKLINFDVICVAIQPIFNKFYAVCTEDNMFYLFEMKNGFSSETEFFSLKLHSKAVSIEFLTSEIIIIGFENGDIVTGRISDQMFEQTQKLKIGNEPCFVSVKNEIGYAVSGESICIIRFTDSIIVHALSKKVNKDEEVIPLENGRTFMTIYNGTDINIYKIKLYEKMIEKENISLDSLLEDDIINAIPIKGTDKTIISTKTKIFLYEKERELLETLFPKSKGKEYEDFDGQIKQIELLEESNVLAFLTEEGRKSSIHYMILKPNNGHMKATYPISLEFSSPITMFRMIQNKIALLINNTISLYSCSNKNLTFVTKTKLEKKISNFFISGDLLYAFSDDYTVRCYEYIKETLVFKLISSNSAYNITSGAKFADSLITGDINGNVVVYSHPKFGESFLSRRTAINVGATVSGVCYKNAGVDIGMYRTVFGEFGALLFIGDNEMFKMRASFLKKVELLIAEEFDSFTGTKYLLFRNQNYPCSNVLNLDVIQLLFEMSDQRKEKICKKLSTNITVERIRMYYNEVRSLLIYTSL